MLTSQQPMKHGVNSLCLMHNLEVLEKIYFELVQNQL